MVAIRPWIYSTPLRTAMATKHRLLMTFISGMRYPLQIRACMDASQRASFFCSNSSSMACSWQKALTIISPETLSSTWPFRPPSLLCWLANSFRVCFVTIFVKSRIKPTPASDTSVSAGLRQIMAQRMPMIVKP